MHPLWKSWDLAVDLCVKKIEALIANENQSASESTLQVATQSLSSAMFSVSLYSSKLMSSTMSSFYSEYFNSMNITPSQSQGFSMSSSLSPQASLVYNISYFKIFFIYLS
jgi:hypothetical protein